jgi:hypothetical protein
MRITYTNLLYQYLRNTGVKTSDANYTNIIADFKQSISSRYQMILAKMTDYKTETYNSSFSTVAGQQYYYFPAGLINIEALYIDLGSFKQPVSIINNEDNWNRLNAIQIVQSQLPQYFFPRRDDFGIWPIPQAVYNGYMSYHYRDRSLSVDDYSTSTVSVTNNSATITGSSTAFTPAMVGRWFTITDTTVNGQGYWYRIGGYVSSTVLTLETVWSGTTSSGATYNIGETPELPEEGHMLLAYGATADFYSDLKNDEKTAARWENRFWTGDPSNTSRKLGDNDVLGGVIGLVNKYTDRNESHIVNRKPRMDPLNSKAFAITLSGS